MDNEINQESWFRRHRLWVFLLSGLFLVGATVVAIVSNFSDFAQTAINTGLCNEAIVAANQNNDVVEKLGNLQPVDQMAILEGNAVYSENGNHAEITVRVVGEKGKAKMDIVADKQSGKWNYKTIRIRIKNPSETIEVLNKLKISSR